MHTLYLDCSSGISGDMTVGALLDLGADAEVLKAALASLPLEGYRIEISHVIKSGLNTCDFNVILDEDNHDHDMAYLHGTDNAAQALNSESPSVHGHVHNHVHGSDHEHEHQLENDHEHNHELSHEHEHEHEHSHDHTHEHNHEHEHSHEHDHEHNHDHEHIHDHDHNHEHSHEHDHEHNHDHEHSHEHDHDHDHHHGRNLKDITSILSAGRLTPHALELALKIFRIVAEAESKVHGKSLDEVHFHEVGAVDSIVDIAAAAVCIDDLGIERVILPALTEGCGQVRCQHGLLPIPVPATTAIVEKHQIPLRITQVQGELVTPTGAAIAAALRTDDHLPGEFKILKTGLGAGKRDYKTAGFLRAMLIEDTGFNHDNILVMETNMDDCPGETMGFVMEQLLAGGALDAFYTPIYMKKHRPAYKLTVLCTKEKRTDMEAVIFRHSTTIGIRAYEVERTKLPRRILSLETPWGMADVKICQFEEDTYCYPESDSIEKLALENHLSYSEMYVMVKKYAMDNSSLGTDTK